VSASPINTAVPSSAAPVKINDDAVVTPIPSPANTPVVVPAERLGAGPGQNGQIIQREERVEYRDAKGNILDAEQVQDLKGKVKFEVSFTFVHLFMLFGVKVN
jgi:hypothetical protein